MGGCARAKGSVVKERSTNEEVTTLQIDVALLHCIYI